MVFCGKTIPFCLKRSFNIKERQNYCFLFFCASYCVVINKHLSHLLLGGVILSAKSLFLKQNVRIVAVEVVFPVKMRQGDFAVALGNKGSPAKSGGRQNLIPNNQNRFV